MGLGELTGEEKLIERMRASAPPSLFERIARLCTRIIPVPTHEGHISRQMGEKFEYQAHESIASDAIADLLRADGFEARREVKIGNGRIDVLAELEGQTAIVEVKYRFDVPHDAIGQLIYYRELWLQHRRPALLPVLVLAAPALPSVFDDALVRICNRMGILVLGFGLSATANGFRRTSKGVKIDGFPEFWGNRLGQ